MPLHVRYVLRRDFPRCLAYRGASVALEIVKQRVGENAVEWVLRAKKIVPAETLVIAQSRFGKYGFETMLFNAGFVLDESSPAGKIMARLEREGYAESRFERSRG